ncbi:LOW QUALITY PROTEIN: chromogranin-A-like [Cottoperca gobio]|uniref:LOW QUALITY PROTEIN: chromogranin-A-like n=1 Tax=Cottoperca gobio TaxID=56716 RepID=A0A6J2P6P0_COTGO|nr:LOW QUALITY PROTEIN: chromogranin-A-like [Cottoperca gobio]
MIGRGLFVLTILSGCVLSLPVTPSQLENEDVKVMKCIVEALADVLSRPRPVPVSQECLVTLKTDDRLVSILRHHNFLKELQEIAVQGGQERAQLQRDAGTPEPTTQTLQTADDVADRSMLEALGGPGERSILSQKKRKVNGDGEEEKKDNLGDGESQEDNDVTQEVKEKRENDKSPGSHVSESVDESSEGKAEKREEEEYEEKRTNLEEDSEEEDMMKHKKGAGSGEKRDAPRIKSKEKKYDEEDEWEEDKRSAFSSHGPKQEEEQEGEEDEGEMNEGEMKRESSLKRWTKRGKALSMKKKAVGKELDSEQEVPHHSQEVTDEEEEEEEEKKKKKKRNAQRSPEEKELQMIARRGPEERRGSEEEGSASRKSEEPEIESLAAIESELENVAQKLHEMRRG